MLHEATQSWSENQVTAIITWCSSLIPPTSNLHSSPSGYSGCASFGLALCFHTPPSSTNTAVCLKKLKNLSRKKTVVTTFPAFNGLEMGQKLGAGAQLWICTSWKTTTIKHYYNCWAHTALWTCISLHPPIQSSRQGTPLMCSWNPGHKAYSSWAREVFS